jgi:GYF domain 2
MSDTWFLSQNKQRLGPYTRDQLLKLAAAGHVRPGDLLRKEDTTAWVPVASVAWLADQLQAPPPPPDDADGDEKAGRARGRKAKKEDRCQRCAEVGPGKAYRFSYGFRDREQKSYNFNTRMILHTVSYRDMGRHAVFLCSDCATYLWRLKYVVPAFLFFLVVVAVAGLGLFFRVWFGPEVGIWGLIGGGVVAALVLVPVGVNLYRAFIQEPERDTMEQIVIGLVKKDFEEKGHADSFFTSEEYDAKFGG